MMNPIILHYPPDITVPFAPLPTNCWSRADFAWTAGRMRKLDAKARTDPSPEIKKYHTRVFEGTPMPDEQQLDKLTRNLDVVKSILSYLDETVGLQGDDQRTVVELCAGTGIITTPLAQYFRVIALELEPKYVDAYGSYLSRSSILAPAPDTISIQNRVTIVSQDVRHRREAVDVVRDELPLNQLASAVIMNPDFRIICDALEIAQDLNPAAIIAVIPLDVIDEAHGEGSDSYRLNEDAKQSTREIACRDRDYLRAFRQKWPLTAVEPMLRPDGTAQTATFLFRR